MGWASWKPFCYLNPVQLGICFDGFVGKSLNSSPSYPHHVISEGYAGLLNHEQTLKCCGKS